KFFNMGEITIAGHKVRALHHGMSGVPGLELFGPWKEGDDVRAAIVEAGRDFGLRQVGSRVYATNTLESGWIPCPLPAVFTGEDGAAAMGTMFAKGDAAKYIDLPLSNYATWPNDKVLLDGEMVGVSTFSGYSYNERSMLSLAIVNSEVEVGTEVVLVWGEE